MKVAIYCRVSKEEQNPKHQEKVLKEYAKTNNYGIYKIYTDITSGSTSSRPALNELMFDSRKGVFETVLIWKLDRLGRSLSHLLNIVNEWEQKGIDFICASQNIDTTTSGGKLTFHILGAVAEFERELISERTKAGMEKALKEGRVGRPKGSKDSRPRKKSGYYLRHASKKVREKYYPPILL